jgi:glycosyltransferase involved in cell wall biosynthesis
MAVIFWRKLMNNPKIAVVIPSYKVSKYIIQVINSIPQFVNYIIVVDDKCPEYSGKIAESVNLDKLIVIYHSANKGVGAAVINGYKKAIELKADIVVKIDGDMQMDAQYIGDFIKPIINNTADYTKGNRFHDFNALKTMPIMRLIGNSGLSFLIKASSGYWDIMDPTNGYTAINSNALQKIDLNRISQRYFFESDMLIHLNISNFVVRDVYISAKYGNEKSSLSIVHTMFIFPIKLFKGFCKRIFLKYFVYDFNMLSVYLIFGIPLVIFGVLFGVINWINYSTDNMQTPLGTIMIASLSIILGMQFLLQSIQIDMNNIPKKIN